MRQTLVEVGVPDTGPTVLPRTTFTTWDDEPKDTTPEDSGGEDVEDRDEPEVIERADDLDYEERMIRQEVTRELRRRVALERIAAMDAPPLRLLVGPEFLSAPRPQQLVPRMLYKDSLARMFGAPGCGKSFLALDIALSIVLGRFWGGVRMKAAPVIYVMAEGQAVNGDRTEAWLSKHGVDPSELTQMYVVPDAVLMTEAAAAPFVRKVAEIKPVLVILDTKNAMMVGEENSATDFAALRRVMDQVRKASGCCVLLVDHTGYEGTRARGSSAATAGMDTEIRVTKDDDQKPSVITAEVTRDKAAEVGALWAWRLMPETPAAVLERADVPQQHADDRPDWLTDNTRLPDKVVDYSGQGEKAVEALARYMRLSTRLATGNQDQVGRNLADARADLKGVFDRDTVGRAWSAIKDMGFLKSVYADPTETQRKRGPHIWRVPE